MDLCQVGRRAFLLAAFVWCEARLARHGGSPVLDPTMFRDRAFSTGLVTQLAFWCGQASFFLVLALYLQQGRGLSPLGAGEVFTILAAAYLLTSLKAPRLVLRYGRDLVAVGALVLAAGDALLMVTVANVGTAGPILALVPGLLLVGAGMGLSITPLVSIVLAVVDPRHAGAASGTLSTVQQLGNCLGVAITGLVFFSELQAGYAKAFELSVAQLGVLLIAVAALTRLVPHQPAGHGQPRRMAHRDRLAHQGPVSPCGRVLLPCSRRWAVEMPAHNSEAVLHGILELLPIDLASRSSNGYEAGNPSVEPHHRA
jgi:MFS family permease